MRPPQPIADLPSLFAPLALREGADALTHAVSLAPSRGAGLLAWVSAYARAEAAVVLEPEFPLRAARLARHVAANALAEAVSALGPPEIPVGLRWPATLLLDGAACGAVRLAAPAGAALDAVPDWLVVGFELRLADAAGPEPGHVPGIISVAEAGGDPTLAAADYVAAWARYLMAGLHDWQALGPRVVCERVLAWLDGAGGARRGIDPATGDLVLDAPSGRRVVGFDEAMP